MKPKIIRAVDGGGNGVRSVEVCGTKVSNVRNIGPPSSVEEFLDFVTKNLPEECDGISYGIAGDIKNHKVMIKSPNMHFLDGVNLGKTTTDKSGLPTYVGNDAAAFTHGMSALLPALTYFMGITWSSGIGLRIIKNGEILAESEGGHVPLDPSPFAPRCGCGVRGCAESILGGESIRRRVKDETEALGIKIPVSMHPCAFLDISYDKGDEWAVSIYQLIVIGMSSFLDDYVSILRLPAIVWRGTFAINILPRIEVQIRKVMAGKLINPAWANEVKFIISPQPKLDGLIGAAHLLSKQLEK